MSNESEPSRRVDFRQGDASSEEIEAAVAQVQLELGDPNSEAVKLARATKLDPKPLSRTAISVKEELGIDPIHPHVAAASGVQNGIHDIPAAASVPYEFVSRGG